MQATDTGRATQCVERLQSGYSGAMSEEVSATARQIAHFAGEHPDYDAIAFDNDGKIIDWQQNDTWANGSHQGERIYVVQGGTTTPQAVQDVLDKTGAQRDSASDVTT
ncbi:hypothetical protein C7458_103281 [Williamsia muralis]|nr:hypothetical protein C7458_103281 [Williamsia marianensis]